MKTRSIIVFIIDELVRIIVFVAVIAIFRRGVMFMLYGFDKGDPNEHDFIEGFKNEKEEDYEITKILNDNENGE